MAEKINARCRNHTNFHAYRSTSDSHIDRLVFDGLADQPYRSTDLPNPRSLYGQCKLMAERRIGTQSRRPGCTKGTVIDGKEPSQARSVHEKLLLAVQSGEVLKMSRSEWRQPAAADNVAAVMLELCERRDLHGLFHWAGSERLNRFEIAQRILEHFNYPIDAVEADDARRKTHNAYFLILSHW